MACAAGWLSTEKGIPVGYSRDEALEQAKMEIGASILEMQYLAQRKAEVLQRLSLAYQRVALGTSSQNVDSHAEFGERGE